MARSLMRTLVALGLVLAVLAGQCNKKDDPAKNENEETPTKGTWTPAFVEALKAVDGEGLEKADKEFLLVLKLVVVENKGFSKDWEKVKNNIDFLDKISSLKPFKDELTKQCGEHAKEAKEKAVDAGIKIDLTKDQATKIEALAAVDHMDEDLLKTLKEEAKKGEGDDFKIGIPENYLANLKYSDLKIIKTQLDKDSEFLHAKLEQAVKDYWAKTETFKFAFSFAEKKAIKGLYKDRKKPLFEDTDKFKAADKWNTFMKDVLLAWADKTETEFELKLNEDEGDVALFKQLELADVDEIEKVSEMKNFKDTSKKDMVAKAQKALGDVQTGQSVLTAGACPEVIKQVKELKTKAEADGADANLQNLWNNVKGKDGLFSFRVKEDDMKKFVKDFPKFFDDEDKTTKGESTISGALDKFTDNVLAHGVVKDNDEFFCKVIIKKETIETFVSGLGDDDKAAFKKTCTDLVDKKKKPKKTTLYERVLRAVGLDKYWVIFEEGVFEELKDKGDDLAKVLKNLPKDEAEAVKIMPKEDQEAAKKLIKLTEGDHFRSWLDEWVEINDFDDAQYKARELLDNMDVSFNDGELDAFWTEDLTNDIRDAIWVVKIERAAADAAAERFSNVFLLFAAAAALVVLSVFRRTVSGRSQIVAEDGISLGEGFATA